MNTSYKYNCCAKESVCKYSEEYKHDCEQIQKNIVGKTTEVRIICKEFSAKKPTPKEIDRPVRFA